MNQFDAIFQSIIDGDEERTVELCNALLQKGCPPVEVLEKGMIPAMDRLGVLLSRGERFIPQILISARAMQSAVSIIRPLMLKKDPSEISVKGVAVVGTVQGDIHTIGKSLVGIMLQSAGFEVIDLGANVSADDFIAAVRTHGALMVALSAMLTTSMNSMRQTVQRLRKEKFDHPVRIVIGGGPITPSFAREIQADFAENMMGTVRLALDCQMDDQ